MSKFLTICSLLANVSAHNYASGKNLRVTQQRKTYCTLLSFNGKKRNPSPADCERAARRIAMDVCESLKQTGAADAEVDDNRCLSFLETRKSIRAEDCASGNEAKFPLFVRVTCPRFGVKKVDFSVYDLVESIPYLDANAASRFRLNEFVKGNPFDYFTSNYWVFERETRCHGLISTAVVPVSENRCTDYYNDEDQAVCNYLRTIFDDLWDLGCLRTRGTILEMTKWHCATTYNAQIAGSQADFCVTKGYGEDVSCDAIELLCGSQNAWNVDDIALPPYFLSDSVIENFNIFRGEGAEKLGAIYAEGPDNGSGVTLQASLDFLQHALKGWRIPFASASADAPEEAPAEQAEQEQVVEQAVEQAE